MNFYDWVSLITICVAGALSPGPSLIVILSISMKFGRKAGFSSAVGHGVAIFIYAISTGLGISFLLGTENNFFFFIKLGGALLLLWMGTSMIISANNANTDIRKPQAPENLFFAFRNGFLIGLLNPKIAAFFTLLFTQFVSPSQPISTSLLMATTVSLIDMAAYCVAVFVSNSLLVKHLFLNYTRARERILGLLLLILAFSFIYESVF